MHPSDEKNSPQPTLSYALAGGGAPKPIAIFPDSGEADMVAMVLESQGIRARVIESASTGPSALRSGTLVVRETDADRAIELLASTPARKRLTIPESELPPAKVLRVETCPRCDSPDLGYPSILARMILATLLLAWLPIFFWEQYGWALYFGLLAGWLVLLVQTRKARCRACGHRWKLR